MSACSIIDTEQTINSRVYTFLCPISIGYVMIDKTPMLMNFFTYAVWFTKITVESWKNINEVAASSSNIINTTSLGMNDETFIAINPKAIPETALVSDLVYTPLETNLLKIAKDRGSRTVDGLGMLIHQGIPGFEAWFGQKPLVQFLNFGYHHFLLFP